MADVLIKYAFLLYESKILSIIFGNDRANSDALA